ncbi:MAG: prolipoprotein diacylglyceryl transferase [Oscillospiraceae bacterium]|nr:prolipoprotein diacylglyceryl transferase [Oscillospiraceae bacterium]
MKYSTISFPGLGIQWNPGRGIQIGSFTIYYYALIIALGVMLAVMYALKRCKQFGLKQDDILDGVLWILPVAVICARAYYCIFSWDSYKNDLLSLFNIRKGGLAIYGGVIGAALCVIVHCRIKKISLLATLDMVALGFLIGQALGRWGNFFNREAFGAATESFLRMGLLNTTTGEFEYYHPTFLYESLWNAAGFVLLHLLSKRRRYDGQIALGYVAWYGLGRTFIEGLRMDSLYWGAFRVSQLLAAVSCFIAAVILIVLAFRPHDEKKLFVNKLAIQETEEKEVEDNA